MEGIAISYDGYSRSVICVGGLAFKFPKMRYGWRSFLQGLLCNMHESAWRGVSDDRLCPIVAVIPGGWLVVMRRARPLTSADPHWRGLSRKMFDGLCVEHKPDSFGLLDGRVVAIDYGEVPAPSERPRS